MLYGCGWEKVESDNFLFFCSSHLYRVQYSCSLGIAFFVLVIIIIVSFFSGAKMYFKNESESVIRRLGCKCCSDTKI